MQWEHDRPQPDDSSMPPGPPPAPWVGGATAGGPVVGRPFADQGPAGPMSTPYQPVSPVDGPLPSTSDDRVMAVVIHLSGLVFWFLGPLVLWLAKKKGSPFVDHHGKEALNFQISLVVYWVFTSLATIVLIGLVFIPLLLVIHWILPIVAAIQAGQGRQFRYRLSLPFVT